MKQFMKAIVKNCPEEGFQMVEVPIPDYKDNQVKVKILMTSFCGTDQHLFYWSEWARKNSSYPLIIGHEFVGIVEAVGKKVKNIVVGDIVTGEDRIYCKECDLCKKGLYHNCKNVKHLGVDINGVCSEYAVIDKEYLYKIPSNIPLEISAFLSFWGVAIHLVHSAVVENKKVALVGFESLSLLTLISLRSCNPKEITYFTNNEMYKEVLKHDNNSLIIRPRDCLTNNSEKMLFRDYYDVVISLDSIPFNTLIEITEFSGTIVLLSCRDSEINWESYCYKNLTTIGAMGRRIPDDWEKLLKDATYNYALDKIIKIFPYKRYFEAFNYVNDKRFFKVVLDWENNS